MIQLDPKIERTLYARRKTINEGVLSKEANNQGVQEIGKQKFSLILIEEQARQEAT